VVAQKPPSQSATEGALEPSKRVHNERIHILAMEARIAHKRMIGRRLVGVRCGRTERA
jgi:hypothetical protein